MLKKIRLGCLILIYYLRRNWQRVMIVGLVSIASLLIILDLHIFDFTPVISEGMVGTYQEHDLPTEVTRLGSKGLVELDKSGRPLPALASSWKTNHDATIFTFQLKPNLKWADNTQVKSQDLEFSIPDVEVNYPDEQTIQFKLKDSYSPFPTLLAKPLYKKDSMIGVGPYQIAKIEKSRIFITKVTLLPLAPNLPKVYIRFYPNEKTALTGFNLGEVQSLWGVSNHQELNNPQLATTQKTDYGKIIAVLFNTKDSLLSNRSVRQALGYAIPKIDKESNADNPLSIFSWAYNSEAKKYLDNPEAAKQASERAKAAVSEELLHKEIVLTATPSLGTVGKSIVDSWKALGFEAKLRVESGIPQNFHALLIAQSIPLDPDQYFLWHSTQDKTNITKYSSSCCPLSARVDKDLEDGRKLIPEEDRKAKYLDFQKALLEDAPAVFLYYPKYTVAYLKKSQVNLDKILPLQLSAEYN